MHISSISPTRSARRAPFSATLALTLATVTFAIVLTAVCNYAYAAEGSQYGSIGQYGEVTRFGGFDTGWYDKEEYDGKGVTPAESVPQPGLFLNPVGFAVDTKDKTPGGDGTAVYVLDRTSDWPKYTKEPGTEWRLQKLVQEPSGTLKVVAIAEFQLPKTTLTGVNVPVGIVGLAIDDAQQRVYTLIYGTSGSGNEATSYAEEIVGWSTEPQNGQLVAPNGLAEETALTTAVSPYGKPGLLSTSTQLATTLVYDPQGLALDVTASGEYLALEGNSATRSSNGSLQGPAIVAQISTANGAEEPTSWTSETQETASGISTNSDGSLNVLLHEGQKATLNAVNLPSNLADAQVILSGPADPIEASPIVPAKTVIANGLASTQAVQLSNGLYASDFYENTAGDGYWNEAENEGIRLTQPTATGVLTAGTPPTNIFDTLGNNSPSGSCSIGDGGATDGANGVSLAPGANGAVWVLTSGKDSSEYNSGSDAAYVSGRQIIEFAPGAAGACAGPSETFSFGKEGSASLSLASTGPLTVPVGTSVEFSASTIDYPTSGGKPAAIYAYEWDPTGTSSGGPNNDGYTTIEDSISDFTPTPDTTKYQYTDPGVYTAKLKLLGDFGEYYETGTIVVQTASPPTAAFTAPAEAQTGQSVTFTSTSQPASGAQIANYHWSFGDGASEDTQSASDTHTYASPGTYKVTLTVRDNDNQESTPVSQQITVTNPPPNCGCGGGNTTTTTTTPAIVPPVAIVDRSATNVSPSAVEKDGEVVVTVSCPATKVSCAGTVEVKTASAVAASVAKATKKNTSKIKKQVLVLAQKSFSLNGGQRETLTLELSTKGATLLKKSKHLKVNVVVNAHDSYGDPGLKTLVLTLSAPSSKKK